MIEIVGELMGIDLIRGSHLSLRNIKRERERERGNALSNELIYSSMMEMWLQIDIYRTIKLFCWPTWPYPNGPIIPPYALIIPTYVKCD